MTELEDNVVGLVAMALAEDVGAGDLTVAATVPAGTTATARIVQKAPGAVFGTEPVAEVFRRLQRGSSSPIEIEWLAEEGVWHEPPLEVARISGDAGTILTGERTALNFLGHLSGVATLTARYAQAVSGTGAHILDTRKTTPGMRLLEKRAVLAGGGVNHRIGLFDAVLIKENHIALAGGVVEAVAAAKRAVGEGASVTTLRGPGFAVEVECETLDQVRQAIAAGADRIMLDNMDLATMREAVAIRDAEAGRPQPQPGAAPITPPQGLLLEASGNVNLETVRSIAETGVELISVGALTHSAPTLDLSMLIEFDA